MQKISYMGNGSTKEFNFNFPFYNNSDIIVLKNETITTDYTVIATDAGLNADIPYNGGKIVFYNAPNATDSITIFRQLPLIRTVDYQPTEKINPTILNQDMNYMLEILKDMHDRLDVFDEQYNDITNKESIQNVLSKILHINQLIDNDEIINKYRTNCITNIPQNIKMSIDSDHVLTIDSRTKAYLGGGTVVSNNSVITYTAQTTWNNSYLIGLNTSGTAIVLSDNMASAATNPETPYLYWFNTTNGKCYINNGSGVATECSLPIGVVKATNGIGWTNIEQIFNGFGFIGSKIFVLPGVKALAPNGRNDDGTLKNTLITTSSIKTTDAYNSKYILNITGIAPAPYTNYVEQEEQPSFTNGIWYQPSTNTMYRILDGNIIKQTSNLYAFDAIVFGNKTKNIKIKQAFKAVDYSDTDFISHQSMPSNKYNTLTWASSGTTYSMPADGYLIGHRNSTAAGQYLFVYDKNNIALYSCWSVDANEGLSFCIAVSKGQSIKISYSAPTDDGLYFFYSNGSK